MPTTPLVECIPNFSEAARPAVVAEIVQAATSVDEVRVLHVDPGLGANRTVVTLAGTPEAMLEAAFRMIRQAALSIDLREHQGAHARMGATDVCPLVPLRGLDLAACVDLAHRLGERVGRELRIPVYLYEAAAKHPQRRNLADIRRGEFAGLTAKMQDPDWLPDYGPQQPHPSAGATVIGARNFLIAYNLNLNTTDVRIARHIAGKLRASGRVVKQPDGTRQRIPGRCPGVKAIGWYIPEYACAQVSTNIVDIDRAPLHVVYETCREIARGYDVDVLGAELIGMVPLSALLLAGAHYRETSGAGPTDDEAARIEAAIRGLNLNCVRPFLPQERVIEYRLWEG